jgi:hypothetical protein
MSGLRPAMVVDATPLAGGARQRGPQRRFEIRCAGCGYGGVVERFPDRCPMCGGSSWQKVDAPVLPLSEVER